MSANVIEFAPRIARAQRPAEPMGPTYHTLLLRDLSVGELANALRFSGIQISTVHGHTVLHRPITPKE